MALRKQMELKKPGVMRSNMPLQIVVRFNEGDKIFLASKQETV